MTFGEIIDSWARVNGTHLNGWSGNPIALDKASVTGRPAFEVPNSSQGEHSLPIYIYILCLDMFKWCIHDVHWFSQKPPWPPRFPKPCLFHAPQKVQSCFPVAAFFARTDAATTASKANWCLSPCQTWRQWRPIEHEQNKCWKKCGCFFWREKLSICLYIKNELAQWVWIERQQAIEIEMWYTLNRF